MRKGTVLANMQQATTLLEQARAKKDHATAVLAQSAIDAGEALIEALGAFRASMEAAGLSVVGTRAMTEGELPALPVVAEETAEIAGTPDTLETLETPAADVETGGEDPVVPTVEEMKRQLPPPANTPAANKARIAAMRAKEARKPRSVA